MRRGSLFGEAQIRCTVERRPEGHRVTRAEWEGRSWWPVFIAAECYPALQEPFLARFCLKRLDTDACRRGWLYARTDGLHALSWSLWWLLGALRRGWWAVLRTCYDELRAHGCRTLPEAEVMTWGRFLRGLWRWQAPKSSLDRRQVTI